MKLPAGIARNTGLYYACCKLSALGWNVMPTARNTRRRLLQIARLRRRSSSGPPDDKPPACVQRGATTASVCAMRAVIRSTSMVFSAESGGAGSRACSGSAGAVATLC